MGRRFGALLRKEFVQLFRDRALVGILIYAFTGAIFAAGHSFSASVENYPTAIYDLSRSPASRELVSRLREPHFRIVDRVERESQIDRWLTSGRVSMVVLIPPDFQRRLGEGDARLQTITDGSMSVTATIASAYVSQIATKFSLDLMQQQVDVSPQSLPQILSQTRVRFNPNLVHSWFSSVLELFNVFTMVGMLLTAAAVVREKEYGTMEQLRVSPAPLEIILLTKIVPTVIVALGLSAISVFGILQPVFHVPFRGSLALFYAVAGLYLFSISSLGLLIATLSRNLAQAMLILLIILTPMMFLSGALTPPEAMHPVVRWLSLLSPMRYFLEFGFGVILKGNGIAVLWPDVLGIMVLGGGLFVFSIGWFRRSL